MSLAEKMRESRKVVVEVGKIKFFGRRPTLEEFGKLYNANANSYEIARKYINDWEVTEKDLFPEGSKDSVPFDAELFAEYIVDSPVAAEKIRDALVNALNGYLETKESLKKN